VNDLIFGLRYLVATLLVVAGLSKAGRASEFERTIDAYRVLPARLRRLTSHIVPPVEIGMGAMLALGLFTTAVATAAAVLLSAFSIALARAVALHRGCVSRCVSTPMT
jgi:uncharacterized membrane protein YphA (DoxX/SURF4 family)